MERTNIHSVESEYPLPGTALTCLNGLKHGGTSLQLFLTGEHPQEFYKLLAESFENHKPVTTEDSALVTDAVLARWYLWRRQRVQAKRETEIFEAAEQSDSPGVEGLKELALFDRYCTQAERSLNRALKNLHMLKKSVLDEEKWRTHLTLQKQKFDLDLKKFELRQEQDSRVADKISAEAKRAAMWAKSDIAKTEKLAQTEKDRQGPIVVENGQCTIIQHCFASTTKQGHVDLFISPPSEEIDAILARRDFYIQPPEQIIRHFHFTNNGLIPADYRDVVSETRAAAESATVYPTLPDDKPGLRCHLSFNQWRDLSQKEVPYLLPKQKAA